MNYLELYRSAYTTKKLWYRLQWSGYTLELIDVYITKRLSYRLQRRRFMNYLEFIDLPTPPKAFGIAYNEVVIH